jgi:phenylpropionate dioxygenase-like ring-hydroxylating dioxygenase large terminal subunit
MLPKYYLSQEIFEREQRKIFRKVWLFAGLKTLLPKNNSFLTRTICGIPVVIQNFHGEIRAFENVCLHRNALIQSGGVGCRPLACPYHGWFYGEHGEVKKIPDCRSAYLIGKSEQGKLKLREFPLTIIGNVIFINLNENPFPIEDQLQPHVIEMLESSSNLYDSEVMVTTFHCKFNWKLAYENLRDANHPRFVHRTSLAMDVTFLPYVDTEQAAESLRPLTDTSPTGMRAEMQRFSMAAAEAELKHPRHLPFHDMVERWGDKDAYYNWLSFPNLHIACPNGGYSFTLEHHIPISPGRTDLEIYWFTTRKRKPYAFSSWNLLSHMHGSRLVTGEDIDIMERVQSALHEQAPVPTQGAYEFMNRLVDRWYTTLMETDHEI